MLAMGDRFVMGDTKWVSPRGFSRRPSASRPLGAMSVAKIAGSALRQLASARVSRCWAWHGEFFRCLSGYEATNVSDDQGTISGCRQPISIPTERDTPRCAGKSRDDDRRIGVLEVPQPNGTIRACRSKVPTVRTPRNTAHHFVSPTAETKREATIECAVGNRPDPDRIA